MTDESKALIHERGQGELNTGLGFRRWFRISPKDTGGAFAVFEEEIPEGAGPPLHIHHAEFEQFTVIDGAVRFHCDGTEAVLERGATVLIPPGARHAFKGVGAGVSTVLIMLSPGRGEGFFRDVEAARMDPHADMPQIVELAARYDIEFVGPPLS